jgi:hypothetical protein
MSQVNITCNPRHGFACESAKSAKYGLYLRDSALRFWAKVDRRSDSECWLWRGGLLAKRYGQFGANAPDGNWTPLYAHRVAWVLWHGEIADDECVCHRCDRPLCVNPHHLFLGSHTDNMQDASRKGRLSIPRPRNRATVDEVRRAWLAGEASQVQLAERFNVHPVQISRWLRAVKERPYQRQKAS